ncbi:helix-turn-helix domain-containing protein [Altericista sp. CCNU0014]|uniref:helix-turn-helix domain-containing protein n=1 Tax=Altericista sp. CCNU0014 TaxID=3082949 RepID=UPI00384E17F2
MPVTDNNLTQSLITLKSQYERSLVEAITNASHLREQLSHVNALLLNQLLSSKGALPQLTQIEAGVSVAQAIALAPAQSLAPSPAIAEVSTPARNSPKAKAHPLPSKAGPESVGKRSPRPLLPAYRGLTRLQAIARLLQTTPGRDMTADRVSEGLFGPLSAAERKVERKSLNTQLYKGQSLNLWQKGTVPGTFTIGAPNPRDSVQPAPNSKAPAAKAKAPPKTITKRTSLPLLPAYAELTKREAIAQILGQHPGEVLHHDTIIQSLYGDLSPEDLKEERIRIKSVLFAGVKDGKWQKASAPSSYFLGEPAAAESKRPGRTPKEPIPPAWTSG